MSEKSSRTTRPATPTPAPPGDHRKRRRNRTTQSCLNCHASKRMCDRKRPACQRCTTLGLTGLCIYEVDDPNQRNTLSDEKALLRSRVAELEGVIREMKNKPHPRWAQKSPGSLVQPLQSSDDDATSALVTVETLPNENDGDKTTSGDVSSLSTRDSELNAPSVHLTPVPTSFDTMATSEGPLTPQDPQFLGVFNLPSSPSSSMSSSPRSTHRMLPRIVVNDNCPINSSIYSVDELFRSACSEPTGFEEGIYGHILDHILHTDQASAAHACGRDTSCSQGFSCGCINNAGAYNSLLELSIRLRKAVESLGRIADHQLGGLGTECQLYRKICELDNLTSSTLGNATCPADRHATGDPYCPPPSTDFTPSTISPNCITNIQQWESGVIRPAMPGTADDDTLMSWGGVPGENWPHVAQP